MTKLSRMIAIVMMTAASGGAARADKQAHAPGSSPEAKLLTRLVGTWKGAAEFDFGGQKGTMQIEIRCRPTAAGAGVACDTKMTAPGMTMHAAELFGYDPGQRQYHWYSVNSRGDSHDHVAEIPTGDALRWVYSGRTGDQPMQEIIDFVFTPDGMKFRNIGLVAGARGWSLAGPLRKLPAPARKTASRVR